MAATAEDVEPGSAPDPKKHTSSHGEARHHPFEVTHPNARRVGPRTSRSRRRTRWLFAGIGLAAVAAAVGVIVAGSGGSNDPSAAVTEDTVKLSENPIVASYQTQLPALAAAVKQSPKDAAALRDYGVALYATGDVSQAKEQYEAELAVNPDDAVLMNNLGNVYRDLGSYDQALQSYQKSISIDPSSGTSYINLANLYQYTLKQPDLSIKTLQQAITNLPDNQDVGVLLGIAYEQSGDTANALKAFQAVLDQNPQNPAAQAGLDRLAA